MEKSPIMTTNSFKRNIVLIVLSFIVLSGSVAFSQDAEESSDPHLGVTVDFTYASQYMWKGYDIYRGDGAFQPSVTLDYAGFYAGVWGSWADSSGNEDLTEVDLLFGYKRQLFEDQWYAVDASLGYTYYMYPKFNDSIDAQDVTLGLALPNLIPLGPANLVPTYKSTYVWDGVQSESELDSGWINTFGLTYGIPITAWIPDQEEQSINLLWDISYNDGALGSYSAWSHSTVGVSTSLEWKGFYFTPFLNYQWSFDEGEKSVNRDDEIYGGVSVGYSF